MGYNKTRSVILDIAGERLSLRTDRDEDFLHELADFLSAQVEELRASARGVSVQQIYLLVALKLADELQQERANVAGLYEEINNRTVRVLEMVDAELRASSS